MTDRLLVIIHPLWAMETPANRLNLSEHLSATGYDIRYLKTYFENLEVLVNRFSNVLMLGPDPKSVPGTGITMFFKRFDMGDYTQEDMNRLIELLSSPKVEQMPLPESEESMKDNLTRLGAWRTYQSIQRKYEEVYIAGGNLHLNNKGEYGGCVDGVLCGINDAELDIGRSINRGDTLAFSLRPNIVFKIRKKRKKLSVILIEDAVFPLHNIDVRKLRKNLKNMFPKTFFYKLSSKIIKELR